MGDYVAKCACGETMFYGDEYAPEGRAQCGLGSHHWEGMEARHMTVRPPSPKAPR